jgi:hypothetical protein
MMNKLHYLIEVHLCHLILQNKLNMAKFAFWLFGFWLSQIFTAGSKNSMGSKKMAKSENNQLNLLV